MQAIALIVIFLFVIAASMVVAPRRASLDGFFGGRSALGQAPSLWVLVLSQVTTWIFARSLMNSAILGYYYGIAGTLAYAAYYLSFLTGGFIVERLREGGARSVQDWALCGVFGAVGTTCYNAVIALRLLSEVFANLLVVGLIAAAVLGGGGHGVYRDRGDPWARVLGMGWLKRGFAHRRGANAVVSVRLRSCFCQLDPFSRF